MTVDLGELRSALTGDVLEPADREYERARLCFNLLIDRRPAAIARCVDAKDVAARWPSRRRKTWRSRSAAAATTPPATARSTTAW